MKKLVLFVFAIVITVCTTFAQVLPTTSTSGNDVWYYIQCMPRSTDLNAKWLTGGANGVALTNTVLSASNDAQLWKVVANGTGIAVVNKMYGTYIDSDKPYTTIGSSVINSVAANPITALSLQPYFDQVARPNGFYLVNSDATSVSNTTNPTLTFQFYSAGTSSSFRPINYGSNAPNINSSIVFLNSKDVLLQAITSTTAYLNSTSEGDNPGQFPSSSILSLRSALHTAQIVYDNSSSSPSSYIAAVAPLESSLALYKQSVIMPIISTGGVDRWYYIQGTRPANTYITAGEANSGAQINELPLIPNDTQLWKLVPNGDGIAIVNKATGEYIQTDVASATNLSTQVAMPINSLRTLVSTEIANNTNRFWIENTANSIPAFRLHAGGVGNNNGLMNWTGNAYDNCSWSFLSVVPAIYTSKVTLSNLDYDKGSGPSAEQSFTVNGSNLKANIVIAPSSNIQVSKTSGAAFSNAPITLTQTDGVVANTTIYVRLKAGLNFSTYSDSIVITSTNANIKKVYCSGTVTRPTVVASTTSVSGLDYDKGAGPSAEKTFTLSGFALSANVVLAPSSNLQISKTSGTGFSNTALSLIQASGDLAETTIYVRLKAGLNNASYSDSITITSTDAITKKVYCTGTVAGSSISISTPSITGFNYLNGVGPSTSKSFSLSANLLTANLTISAGSNFELSTNNVNFSSNAISLVPVNGSINLTNIYVRLKAGLATGNYTENISLQSTGVITKTISCSGSVLSPKLILSTTQLSSLSYDFDNGPSDQQSFTVSGTDLSSNVYIIPPANFQLSKVSGGVFTSSTISLAPSAGVLSATTLYARLKAGLPVSTYTGNISLSSTGVTTATVACSGSVIDISTGNVGSNANQLKVYSSTKGIVLEGVGVGQQVTVYTIYGSQIYAEKCDGKCLLIQVPNNAIYLLKVNNKTFKVIL